MTFLNRRRELIEFNTSTLGYKLRSGKLKSRRNHSEQLNKYLAGLMDADGSCSLVFNKTKDYYTCSVSAELTQSEVNDPEFVTMQSLKQFHNLGNLHFNVDSYGTPICRWRLNSKDTAMLFNRLSKHLRIKATHMDNLLWIKDSIKGVHLTESHIEELKEYSVCSRKNSRWFKYPKHPSWAWVAGYLDGDGKYDCKGRYRVRINISKYDKHIVVFMRDAFKGNVSCSVSQPNVIMWERALGTQNASFAVDFLKKMRMYTCLPPKLEKIQEMLNYHENKRQQRLSDNHSKE